MPQGGGEIPLPRGVVFCISDRHCGENIFEDISKFSERDMPPVGLRSWIYHFPHLKSKTHKALEKAVSMSNAAVEVEIKQQCFTQHGLRKGTSVTLFQYVSM